MNTRASVTLAWSCMTLTTLVLTTLVVGCAPTELPTTLSQEQREAVRRANLAYPAAWVAGDAQAVRNLLTDDAVLMPSGGSDPRIGKAEINEFFWPEDAPVTRVTEFSMEPAEIGGTPSLAFSRGAMTLQFELDTESAIESFRTSGTYLMHFLPAENGEWLISHYMWNHPSWELVDRQPRQ